MVSPGVVHCGSPVGGSEAMVVDKEQDGGAGQGLSPSDAQRGLESSQGDVNGQLFHGVAAIFVPGRRKLPARQRLH